MSLLLVDGRMQLKIENWKMKIENLALLFARELHLGCGRSPRQALCVSVASARITPHDRAEGTETQRKMTQWLLSERVWVAGAARRLPAWETTRRDKSRPT